MNDYGFRCGQYQRGHVYKWISMANHSCNPNAFAVPGSPGTLRALRDIREGEEVTITYGKDKARFSCRCEVCGARRARYSLGMSSTDSTTGDFIRKGITSLGRSRSSRESSSRVEDDDGDAKDADSGQHRADGPSIGLLENTASAFRSFGRAKQRSTSAEHDGPVRPAKKAYDGQGALFRSPRGGADDGDGALSVRQKMRAYIEGCKTEIGRWFGRAASISREA
ncbi:hypothetical protein VUR80DRAFT_1022 [Thermomyces stellatus]